MMRRRREARAKRWAGRLAVLSVGVAASAGGLVVPAAALGASVEADYATAGLHEATVYASINPEGAATSCDLEYMTASLYAAGGWADAQSVPCEPGSVGEGASPVAVSANLTGLSLATAYEYRFAAVGAGGTRYGAEEEFATFGIEHVSVQAVEEGGAEDTRAGSHPYEMTVSLAFPYTEVPGRRSVGVAATTTQRVDADIRDVLTELPAGLIGDPMAVERCSIRAAEEKTCTGNAQVGMIEAYIGKPQPESAPLYDTVAPEGSAASFVGFVNASTDAFIDASVRTGSDYGVTAGSMNISGRVGISKVVVRLWGVPAAASHDEQRACPGPNGTVVRGCASTESAPRPFLTMPTECSGPLQFHAKADSYQGIEDWVYGSTQLPGMEGCGALTFAPTLEAKPTSASADSPTGLDVRLAVPQDEKANGLATPQLKDTTVVLPPGLTVNPSSAAGLTGCGPAANEFGLTTPVGQTPIETTNAPAQCPPASKIGTVEIVTPLLDHPLRGGVYLAEPYQNPFGSLLAIYIAVDDPASGVVIKLAGRVEVGAEGQLTTTFSETPQLPFSEFKLHFFEGPRAPLMTPSTCSSYSTNSSLLPWSAASAAEAVGFTWPMAITASAGGGACPTSVASEPNAPSFEAGGEATEAGAYTPFVLHLKREDGSQRFAQLTVTPPPGLLGKIAGVARCTAAEIAAAEAASGATEHAAPSCPQGSEVGTISVGAGAGPDPFYVTGHVYLTGPYAGAPFGLAIITPALAGPFDLGDVVVRAGIYINPVSAQVTVRSAPIPAELKGIQLDIRSVNVRLGRSGFTLNPTSCAPMSVAGQEVATTGQAAALSDRFQVSGCESLPFKPVFTALTRAKVSRRDGASLTVNMKFPGGTEANVAEVKVQLPKRLPSRDSTLEQACVEAQFNANPAGCPEGSRIGTAKAVTPILGVPLEGPVYFVSYGHLKFPEVVAVLQGEGVTIDLHGETHIGKNGVTTSTFRTVPDAPVSEFDLTLPEGEHSALAAPAGHLCEHHLLLPTLITAHNGKAIAQRTRLTVSGCGDKLKLVKHHERHKRLILKVAVPAAGRLVARGSDLNSQQRAAKGPEILTLRLKVRKLRHRTQRTAVTLVFHERTGHHRKKLEKKVKLELH